MPTSDALIVVEDWISEHFFTTDARKESFQKLVLDRRKQWDSEDIETPRSKFTKQASKLATTLAPLRLPGTSRTGCCPGPGGVRPLILNRPSSLPLTALPR